MTAITGAQAATWTITAIAAGGVIGRPWRLPEAVWAVLGAASLVALALVPWQDALGAVGRGTDVYLFLIGMMMLAELARKEGLFDWLVALAARQAKGSAHRLFSLIFWRGHDGNRLSVKRRHGRRPDPGSLCHGKGGRDRAPALSLHLLLRRQCGEFCPADLKPGEPRCLREPYAAPHVLARAIRSALGPVNWGDLRGAQDCTARGAAAGDHEADRRTSTLA